MKLSAVDIKIPRRVRFRPHPKTITFFVVALASFFTVYFIFHFGFSHGKLFFDESVPEATRELVSAAAKDLKLSRNITVSAENSFSERPDSGENTATLLYEILVPVVDFETAKLNISENDLENLLKSPNENSEVSLIPINQLSAAKRLLTVDEKYFLDAFSSGAVFQYLNFSGSRSQEISNLISTLAAEIPDFPSQESVLTLAETGVTALSRRITAAINSGTDPLEISAPLKSFFSNYDYVHTSNEASFSTKATSENICALPSAAAIFADLGINLVELTGNHNLDCGDQAALDSLAIYADLGIKSFGGGATAASAAEPLLLSDKSSHLTLLGYNYSSGGATTDATPGANLYTEDKAQSDIAAAKARGDFTIVHVQFYECNEYVFTTESTICDYASSSEGDQINFFRHLADLGADLVVGTSAHQPQTFELYNNTPIYYGLGNLYFDQSTWPGTTRSLILGQYFYHNQLLQTRISPTVYDSTYATELMSTTDSENFLARLLQAQPEKSTTTSDLQEVVNAWQAENPTIDASVVVENLDNGKILAEISPDQIRNVASIYKLFFAYALYQQSATGKLALQTDFVTTSDYRAGEYTLEACLDLIIRESYNGCAEPIRNDPDFQAAVEELIKNLKLTATTDLGLYSSANDLTTLLEEIYKSSSWQKLADSMLDQPATEISSGVIYDWRQGLPAGFSENAKVYNKVGWEWSDEEWQIYSDAAIVEFPETNQHFAIVALTSGIAEEIPTPLHDLAKALENAIKSESQ